MNGFKKLNMSRREWLKTAASGFTFATVSPLFYGLFRHATAQAATDPIKCKIVHIHLGGGWASKHTFVARDKGGQLVSASLLPDHYGQPSDQFSRANGLYSALGAPLYDKLGDGTFASFFSKGLQEALNADATANTFLTTIPTQSQNDNTPATIGGLTEPIAMLLDRSSVKPLIAHMVGLTNSSSGNGSSSFLAYPSIARITAQSVTQLKAVASFSQVLAGQGANQTALNTFAAGLNEYMSNRVNGLGASPGEATFSAIQRAATSDLMGRVAGVPGLNLDLTANAAMLTLLGRTAGNFLTPDGNGVSEVIRWTSTDPLMWTAIYDTLLGAYACCSFSMGGYDYHGEVGTGPDLKDERAGRLVGQIIRAARLLDSSVMIYITTDGGLRPTPGAFGQIASTTARWSGDDGNHIDFAAFLVKSSKLNAAQKFSQIGDTAPDTGFSNTSSVVGSDRFATASVFGNWAYLNGLDPALVDGVLQSGGINQNIINELKSTIAFQLI